MDLSLRSIINIIKTSNYNLKKHITTMNNSLWWMYCGLKSTIIIIVLLSRLYIYVTLVSRYTFWQLSIENNKDVHKDVHYQVKHRLYMPLTSS